MKILGSRFLISTVVLLAITALPSQDAVPAYLNRNLSPQQRAADLVHRMTVEEKVTQLVNQSRAVPRLNVPDYDWWSESLHGVARNRTTEFPGRSTWPLPLTPMRSIAWRS
jgi:beta-glucosidase-like glycosyl hydrolase